MPPEVATSEKLMTVEEFLALPTDGIDRELIRGRLRERGMTVHNRVHSRIEATVARLLGNWLEQQPEPRGMIHSGKVGFRLHGTSETCVGIDVAYVSAELVSNTPESAVVYDGSPTLAVEILLPSDKIEDIVERIGLYVEAGIVVWVLDPYFQMVTIHRPNHVVEPLNSLEELSAEEYLPGFVVEIAKIFAV